MATQSIEGIARNYANLIEQGFRTIDSIKNTLVRDRVQEMIDEDKKQGGKNGT
jgi:hypothetical protein